MELIKELQRKMKNINEMKKKKLNLGCGKEILEGYTNLDIIKMEGVDIVHDLDKFPYPFPDNYFEEIIIKSVLEHLGNTQEVMWELWRISKPNSIINISVPHFSSLGAFIDPTHKQFFTYYSLDYYCENPKKGISLFNYSNKAKFRIIERKIIYPKYFKIFEWIANKIPLFHEIILRKFLPVKTLYFKLEVIK